MRHQEEQQQTLMSRGVHELLHTLIILPPVSIMVLFRRNIGYRLLKPVGLLAFVAIVSNLNGHVTAFSAFAVYAAACGVLQRIIRWWEGRRGVRCHSYYLGDSIFDRLMPASIRHKRIMARFFDPVVYFGLGWLLFQHFRTTGGLLGAWLMVSGVMLLIVEVVAYFRQFQQDMDMVDGMVYSEYQGDKVDNMEDNRKETPKYREMSDGLATGLGADISDKVRQRRRSR